MADAPDSKSGGATSCEFESHLGYLLTRQRVTAMLRWPRKGHFRAECTQSVLVLVRMGSQYFCCKLSAGDLDSSSRALDHGDNVAIGPIVQRSSGRQTHVSPALHTHTPAAWHRGLGSLWRQQRAGRARPRSRSHHRSCNAAFSGTVSGTSRCRFSSDGSSWVDLGSLNGITIELQSNADTTSVHGEISVPVGSYSRVRLTFSNVSADLDAGSVIGNTTLTNSQTADLDGSDQQAEVIKSLNFSVPEDETVRISLQFRLNSASWLTEAALAAGFVEDDALASITVSSRSEPRS